MKLEIKNRFTQAVIFTHEVENNTIVKTVLAAIASRADLSGANLPRANLSRANLSCANLSCADLSCADLSCADLYGANLSRADLSRADLSRADLSRADLSDANLSDANLSDANLYGANLSRADLSCADLSQAINTQQSIAATRICPEGDLIGYKKCKNGIMVKLLIPAAAKRNNAFGRKCRAEYADVLEIYGAEKAVSTHDNKTTYEVGKRVTPELPYEEKFWEECASGIHFFITRYEAENY